MTSDKYAMFSYEKDGIQKWCIAPFDPMEDDIVLDAAGDIFSLSPSAKYIAFASGSVVNIYNVEEKDVISRNSCPGFIKISFLKWTDDSNLYIATSEGLMRYSVITDEIEAMSTWHPNIQPNAVCDIQVDEPTGNYIVSCSQDAVGGIQYGVFKQENIQYFPGRAAALYRVNNIFYKNELFRTISHQDPENPINFLMKTECLTNPNIIDMTEIGMEYDGPYKDDIPSFLIPDPESCCCYLTAGNKIIYFDMLNGLRVFTVGFSHNQICGIARGENGSVVLINEHEKNVARVSIPNKRILIEAYTNLGDGKKLPALHLACRFQLPGTQDSDMRDLCHALFSNVILVARSVLSRLVKKMSGLPDSQKAIDKVGEVDGLRALMRDIYDIWHGKDHINWLKELENWVRKQMNWPLLENDDDDDDDGSDGEVDVDSNDGSKMGKGKGMSVGRGKTSTSVDSLAKKFVDTVIEVDSEDGKSIMKELIQDPFERVKKTRAVRKRVQEVMKEEYEELATRMKQYDCILPGNEYWKAVLEEVYEDEEKRAQADRELRKYIFKK